MQATYESETLEASSESLVKAIADHMWSLKPIQTLDEYIHYHNQLIAMRQRNDDFIPEAFAMELAVLFLLNDYDRKIGMPELEMLGHNMTPKQRIMPERWVKWG